MIESKQWKYISKNIENSIKNAQKVRGNISYLFYSFYLEKMLRINTRKNISEMEKEIERLKKEVDRRDLIIDSLSMYKLSKLYLKDLMIIDRTL